MESTLQWMKESWDFIVEMESEVNEIIFSGFKDILVRVKIMPPPSGD